MQVKAAGGVRTLERLLEVRALGVTHSGATATATMLDDCKRLLATGEQTDTADLSPMRI